MIQSKFMHSPMSGTPLLKTVLPGAGLAIVVALALAFGPSWIVSSAVLKTMTAVAVLLVPLCVVLAAAKARAVDSRRTTFALALFTWWFLLICDELFDRISYVQNTYEGRFSVDAW